MTRVLRRFSSLLVMTAACVRVNGVPPAQPDLGRAADLAAHPDLTRPEPPPRDAAVARDLSTANAIVMHAILPSATYPKTTLPNDPHLTWSSGTGNGLLLIFLPGTNGVPSGYTDFLGFAASLGYHVIGLDWPNQTGAASTLCNDNLPCYQQLRLESWQGTDETPVVSIDVDNCIHNRINKLLSHLVATYPDEGWGVFDNGNGEPDWNRVVMAGHSQGGGNAAFVASFETVARVVMFSAVTDSTGPSPVPVPAPWIKTHITPSERYYGLDHRDDKEYFPKVSVDWPLLGMDAWGGMVDVDSESPPYGGSHELTGTRALTSPHNQVIANSVPLVDGVPVYEEAWRYMITF